ncbi:hypothetical protein QBC34DRAFT_382687 [Podospora aff. communis PSN243]|uniref:DUF7587 domain-containing protein n=1 Tax=Podospora aff. communis PSN243 TaxID=3040156 RepID=A0AAV9GIR8_9PEZI|nr:hypothetical protein QBC34DRAFT_382687 [Podospora aff. communis PSN243]
MSRSDNPVPPLLFSDPGTKDAFQFTPTYLFRLYAPVTRGTTNTNEVSSPAQGSRSRNSDLLGLPRHKAASLLNAHLRWHCQDPGHEDCNLMSWSSSLLFILKLGLYRKANDHSPRLGLDDLRILIVDTSLFPQGTFIRDMDAIKALKAYSYGSDGLGAVYKWRTGDYYFGEYLSQGYLDVRGRCAEATVEELVGGPGPLLKTLCPRLLDPSVSEKLFAKDIVNIRQGFTDTAMTDIETVVDVVVRVSACFENPWRLPVAVMLLSLRHRRHEDVVAILRVIFDEEEINSLRSLEYGVESYMPQMPELGQYRQVMLELLAATRRSSQDSSDSDDIASTLSSLTL